MPMLLLVIQWHCCDVQYPDKWERRSVLGIHPQKQEGLFWVGAKIGRAHV